MELGAIGNIQGPALLYEYLILEKNNQLIERYQGRADLSAGAGVLTLLLAGVLLYFDLTDEPEVGEIGQQGSGAIFWFVETGTEADLASAVNSRRLALGARWRF